MPNMSDIVRFAVRKLGPGTSSRAVRLLRNTGIFTPLRVLCTGFDKAERSCWAHCRAFRAKYAALLNGNGAHKGTGPTVLFAHLSPAIAVSLVEGMFAKALQLRGCRPVFVTNRLNPWSEEYLRIFGYRDFICIEDYLPASDEYDALAAQILAKCRTTHDVLELRFRDADVGRHALSSALRKRMQASVNFSDKVMMDEVRQALAWSMKTVIAAEKIIDLVQPAKLFVSEKGYSQWAEFYDVSLRRSIETIHWYKSHQEDSILLRKYRYADRYEHYFTLADETWEKVKQIPWTPQQGEALKESLKASYLSGVWLKRKNMLAGKKVKTPQQLRAELNLTPSKPNVFVFSHVLWDATFWYGKNLFSDYGTWLIETIRAACRNSDVNWVIKMHPDNVWKTGQSYELGKLDEYVMIRNHFPDLPRHVVLMPPENDTNPVSLFGFADYAITVRGTVGLEFPCFGIPTLTAGTGRYSGQGFTYDSDSREEYLQKLQHIQNIPLLDEEQISLAQRFCYAVFHLRPLPIRSFTWHMDPMQQFGLLMPYEFTINVSTLSELEKAEDLSLFADWVLNSTRLDFMMPTDKQALEGM